MTLQRLHANSWDFMGLHETSWNFINKRKKYSLQYFRTSREFKVLGLHKTSKDFIRLYD
jgi:hypothetical protein